MQFEQANRIEKDEHGHQKRRLRSCNVTFLSHLLHDLGCHPAGRAHERVPDFLPT